MKGLTCWIYSNHENGSLNLIRTDRVTLTGEGVVELSEPNEKYPEVRFVKRELFGDKIYFTAYPVVNGEAKVGMFGGKFIYTGDSRFPSDYPIPLHDRFEY